jgi:DNA-binding transcriptional regulator WhiA
LSRCTSNCGCPALAAGRLETLPAPLREIADLRIRFPSLSLRELGRKCRPPATKASAHRRLAKLQRLAEA